MKFRNYVSLLFIWTFVFSCSFENDRLAAVTDYLDSLHSTGRFDGSVTVGNTNGAVLERSFGTAVREWDIPIDRETRFDIASLNKSFVGYMIMQLHEAGKLSVHDTITDHLDFNAIYADQITIHQLLTHTSGLPDYDAIADSLKENRFEAFKRLHFNNDEYMDFIEQLKPVGKPGDRFYYSNFAYHVLSFLIEEKTGLHFSKALDSMICKPLGLHQTYAPLDNYVIYPRLAFPYDKVEGKFQRSPFIDYSLGRRIFSTTHDLYKWGKEMASPTLMKSSSVDFMLTNHIGDLNNQVSYGYGWVVFDGAGDYRMGKLDVTGNYIIHGGATDGYKSLLIVYERGNWIVSLLGNTGDQINELGTGEQILKLLTQEK